MRERVKGKQILVCIPKLLEQKYVFKFMSSKTVGELFSDNITIITVSLECGSGLNR